jgi:hypothetical protein
LKVSTTVGHLPIFNFRGDRRMDDDNVTEDQCSVCSAWPAADRADRRRGHYSGGYVRMPLKSVCNHCQIAFWRSIFILVDSQEELEALREAIISERRMGFLRPAFELLEEIRNKAQTRH